MQAKLSNVRSWHDGDLRKQDTLDLTKTVKLHLFNRNMGLLPIVLLPGSLINQHYRSAEVMG